MRVIKISDDTYKEIVERKRKIEAAIKQQFKTNINIPISKLASFQLKRKLTLAPNELLNIIGNNAEKKNNKKGFSDVLYIIVLIGALIVFAPILLKVITSILSGFSMSNISVAQNLSEMAQNKIYGVWDGAIFFLIFSLISLLFISAYFINTHPFFIVVYIICAAISFLTIPFFKNIFINIYTEGAFSDAVIHLPILQFLIEHYTIFILAIIILSGIILYAKAGVGAGERW